MDTLPAVSQQCTAAVGDQMRALGVSLDSQQSALCQAETAVSRFVMEELKVDLPTGTTPQRRGFTYPRTLTHCKPHSELLEEYHAQTNGTLSSLEESPITSVSVA